MHARISVVQSTKPKIAQSPTSTTKKQDEEEEKNEQRKPPRPGVLLEWKERVGAHVVAFTALTAVKRVYSNRSVWKIFNNVQPWHEVHICTLLLYIKITR